MQLKHGIPKSNYFLIAKPYDGRIIGDYVSIENGAQLKNLTLQDPKTGEEHETQIHDIWRFKVDQDGNLINAWAKLTYGITGKQLVNIMTKRYPGFNENLIIDFLLLKKL